ncbi:MAG: lysine exporter LysO family protein [Slackia sp.]|nr:lysine exporter LysO family protein [Slackia sp.]
MEILIVMCVGVLVGATVFPDSLKRANATCTLAATGLLIFSMGAMLGGREGFIEELVSIGSASLAFAVLPILFSVVFVYLLSRAFMADITRRHAEDAEHAAARESVDADGGEATMIAIAVGALVFGVAAGLAPVSLPPVDFLVEHSDWVLFALMFFVGISVGGSKGLIGKIKQYHVRVFIIPFGIVVGSVIGGLAAAFLCGIPLPVGGAIASGLGWYSLSGVMLTGIAGAEVGSITFLANLLRELISFFTIPWIARHLNYPTCIAPAGATSEDTTLPMMVRCTNGETVVLSVVNGVICSALVPVLIEFFHALM